MKQVKTLDEVNQVFDLLGIKEVGKRCQHKRGNYVYELPFKTCYASGSTVPIKFAVYTTGYVRRVEGAFTCYQINKQRQEPEFFKDYKWNENWTKQTWTGKYRKYDSSKRILIDRHDDRIVYLCNYLLRNIYNTSKWSLVGDYTRECMKKYHHSHYKAQRLDRDLPFRDDDIKVIINGHRYNLS